MSILFLLLIFDGTLDFHVIFTLVPLFDSFFLNYFTFNLHCLSIIGFFLVLGAIGKSAQLGLHT